MDKDQQQALTPEEIFQQKQDLENIKNSIFSTLKTKSAELNPKIAELQEMSQKKCNSYSSEDKIKACFDKFNTKLNSESEIFNNAIFKHQTKAFRCFMTAQINKQEYNACEQDFITGIDDSIDVFFQQMSKFI